MFKDRQDNSYPPRSHDCTSNKTEFANAHEDAQLDVERREKNIKHRRTMKMWKNSVEQVWKSRQHKVMQAIIDAEGGRTSY